MFENNYFDKRIQAGESGWGREAITYIVMSIIIGSLVYYAIVFISEIFGCTPKMIMRICNKEKLRLSRLESHNKGYRHSADLIEMTANPIQSPTQINSDLARAKTEAEMKADAQLAHSANLLSNYKRLKKENEDLRTSLRQMHRERAPSLKKGEFGAGGDAILEKRGASAGPAITRPKMSGFGGKPGRSAPPPPGAAGGGGGLEGERIPPPFDADDGLVPSKGPADPGVAKDSPSAGILKKSLAVSQARKTPKSTRFSDSQRMGSDGGPTVQVASSEDSAAGGASGEDGTKTAEPADSKAGAEDIGEEELDGAHRKSVRQLSL